MDAKKIFFITAFIFFAVLSSFAIANQFEVMSDNVVLENRIVGVVDIGDFNRVNSLEAFLKYFPREDHGQKILHSRLIPDYASIQKTSDEIAFKFDNVNRNTLEYGVFSIIENSFFLMDITEKVDFPLHPFPEEHSRYVLPSRTVDSDNVEIRKFAYELAGDEDDLFKVMVTLAEWVSENVNYNLSTIADEVSYPASWVFENREGVCSEITNLFIAFARSLGVPARFVSGIAYSSANYTGNVWEMHGWSEIYFPGFGWVPFDVTYKQFGYTDPAHIKLSSSTDATEGSTLYRWKGDSSEIKINPLDISTTVESQSGKADEMIDIEISMFSYEVGSESYNLVSLDIQNNRNSYSAPVFYLSNVRGVEIIDGNYRYALLEPKGLDTVHWIIKISEARQGYIYTIPVNVRSILNEKAESSFTMVDTAKKYDIDDFMEILQASENKRIQPGLVEIDFLCQAEHDENLYVNMTARVNCRILNNELKPLNDIEICLKDECRKINLSEQEELNQVFDYEIESAGANVVALYLKHNDFVQHQVVVLNAKDFPQVIIDDLEHPSFVSYDDVFEFKFSVVQASYTEPLDVNVNINHRFFYQTISIDSLKSKQELILNVPASSLNNKENIISIEVTFKDSLGNSYQVEEKAVITLTGLTFFQRFQLWVRGLFVVYKV
ncbi:MAG: transglutaminase-like domain-containing protein [Candidatus Woesearchaeota archaeon]